MILWQMLLALVLTVVLEGGAMLLYSRRWRFVYYSLLLNLLTNPLLNLLLWLIALTGGRLWYTVALWVLEVCVVLGEGLLYAKLCGWPLRRALLVSLGLNGLSLVVGLALAAVR